jgi:peptide chain release factor 1
LTFGLDHLVIEVVAFAGALADAGQHRIAAVALGDVVDQLLHGHGLADAGAAEQADLAALGVGAEQVDDLDAGDEDLRRVDWSAKDGASWWMPR